MVAIDDPADDTTTERLATEVATADEEDIKEEQPQQHETLKYSLLGPSLLKAGQDSVDQSKVSEIIYNASKGSKFFNREEVKDKILTEKIARIRAKKAELDTLDLSRDLRLADTWIAERELSRDLTQHIVHVDCDAFYAAVEQLDRPELADVPFAVGGGVLTTCNYVARKFGCRSGMAGFVAKKLCPDLILLRLNFDKYTAKAEEVREVLAEYDPQFESASIDEAYLNITQYCADHGGMDPGEAVEQMRAEVRRRTRITVSAGIAANARLAKICSNINKPNGQFVLPNARAAIVSFMRDLPCRKVNGVGRVFERELAAVGVATCGDVYAQRACLARLFGDKAFRFLVDCHLGLGRTRVQPAEDYERKSVGTESTFGEIVDPALLREKLRQTADELEKDMKRAECKGRTLVLKVKMRTFEVYTRQVVLPRSVQLADDLYAFALPMLARLEKDFPGMSCRLMGLRCTHLVSTRKPDTMSFFGFKTRRRNDEEDLGDAASSPPVGQRQGKEAGLESGWEQWPDDELDGFDVRPGDDAPNPTDADAGPGASPGGGNASSRSDSFRRHGKEILPNPKPQRLRQQEEGEEWWDCPICARPQAAEERLFNEHIDTCLSKQAIRDTVQQDAAEQVSGIGGSGPGPAPAPVTAESAKRAKTAPPLGRKRGRRGSARSPDLRQKKICFG